MTENIPGAELGTGPWPNQTPVVDGITPSDEVNQDPNWVNPDEAPEEDSE